MRIDLDEPEHPLARRRRGHHALLATFPPGELPGDFVAIGRVLDGSGVTVEGEAPTGRTGWHPYDDWNGGLG